MRTLFFCYALLTLLSACSKDNGTPSSSSTSGVGGTNCPDLNGTYSGMTPAGETLTYTFTTVRNGALTSYTFAEGNSASGYAIPADGSKLTGQSDQGPITLSLACGNSSLIISTQTGSQAVVSLTFTDMGGNQLIEEAAGQQQRLVKQ